MWIGWYVILVFNISKELWENSQNAKKEKRELIEVDFPGRRQKWFLLNLTKTVTKGPTV